MKKVLCAITALMLLCCACTPKRIPEPDPSRSLTIWFIDVGQGDCTLLESAGEFMLVDSGEREYCDDVINFLRERGVKKLTSTVSTHPHTDHTGGMKKIINTFGTDSFITRETDSDASAWIKLLETVRDQQINFIDAKPGSTYTLGEAEFSILAPLGDGYEDCNDFSVAMTVSCGKARFLLTGDAEQQSEYEMLEAGEDLQADVYQCGHHGASDSSNALFLQAVNPAYAVISCGKDNEYGHPHQETLDRLALLGAEPLRTDLLGTVSAVTDGTTITLSGEGGSYSITVTAGEKKTDPAALNLVGDTESLTFHDPVCSAVGEIKEQNRITFTSRKEAVDRGFEPCSRCKP